MATVSHYNVPLQPSVVHDSQDTSIVVRAISAAYLKSPLSISHVSFASLADFPHERATLLPADLFRGN